MERIWSKTSPLLLVVLLSAVVWGLGFGFLRHERQALERQHLRHHTESYQVVWQAVLNSQQAGMRIYVETMVLRPEVLAWLQEARNGSEAEREMLRHRLYLRLQAAYQTLQERQVRQLHFHTPDNRSFLRFHSPQRFGDSLAEIRPSVVRANRDLTAVQGFETGRSIAGFRNVFPIVHNGEHLGSVELSQPFEAMRQGMRALDASKDYLLVFNRDLLLPKLFDEFKGAYVPSDFHPRWLLEVPPPEGADVPPPLSAQGQALYRALASSGEFLALLERGEAASMALRTGGGYHVVTLHPLIDLEGGLPAALLSFGPAPVLAEIAVAHRLHLLLFTLFVFFASLVLYFFLRNRRMLAEKSSYLQLLTDTVDDGLYVLDHQGVLTFANDRAAEILGFAKEELQGQVGHDLFHRHGDGARMPLADCPIYQAMLQARRYRGEENFVRKDGTPFVVEVSSSPMIVKRACLGSVTLFRDITERKTMEEKLLYLSHTDPLTTAFNRRYFQQALETEFQRAQRYATTFSLAMFDLDHFKSINDSHGHKIGDQVLKAVVTCSMGRIRTSDVFARWGGEEFVLLLVNTSLDSALPVLQVLLEDLRTLRVGEVRQITASFGLTQYRTGCTVDRLLQRADRLVYRAKETGRDRIVCDTLPQPQAVAR